MKLLTQPSLQTAQQKIAAADNTMATLMMRLSAVKLVRRQPPFHVLAVSIINQQLSQKAAAAIEKRIALLTPPPFDSTALSALSTAKLRRAGLSASKINYLHALADADSTGVLAYNELQKLPDEEVIARLTTIRGVGRWTAEMFLMFCLRRPDVLSLGDAGLLRAARHLYGKRFRGDDAVVLEKAAQRWRPWRTVGCYYLWKALDEVR